AADDVGHRRLRDPRACRDVADGHGPAQDGVALAVSLACGTFHHLGDPVAQGSASQAGASRAGTFYSRGPGSVTGVPLLFPRVAVVVVAVALPEAGAVFLQQLNPAHPLGALPEVEMRDEQPCGSAV